MEKGFTLLELIVVVVIIGILATLGLVNFGPLTEKTIDREANANLKVIQAAENTYYMENATYYPNSSFVTNITDINTNLKLRLPATTKPNWNYTVYSTGCADAARNVTGGRTWCLRIDDNDGEPYLGVSCSSCPQ